MIRGSWGYWVWSLRQKSHAIHRIFHHRFFQMDSTFAAFNWSEKNLFGWQGGLKKAFDTVDHSVLLNKLYHYGNCRMVSDWSSSYLSGRTQTTKVNSLISRKQIVPYGVPQDSFLGPLPFLIYINDIFNSSKKFDFICLLTIRICFLLIKT